MLLLKNLKLQNKFHKENNQLLKKLLNQRLIIVIKSKKINKISKCLKIINPRLKLKKINNQIFPN